MTETQSQILFQEEFVKMMKNESTKNPQEKSHAVSQAYERLASEACLIPSKWSALPWQYQLAFEKAVETAYEAGFRDGCKMTNGLSQ